MNKPLVSGYTFIRYSEHDKQFSRYGVEMNKDWG